MIHGVKVRRLIDERPQRERILILLAVSALIYFVWALMFHNPLQREEKQLQEEIDSYVKKTATLDQQIEFIMAQSRNSDLHVKKEQHERLRRQHGDLDRRLQSLATDLISPSRMAQVLQNLLSQAEDIKLVGLHSLPAEPLILQGGSDKFLEKEERKLYKHGFVMNIKGEYFSILRHLRKLERLRWRLYWDSLNYKVENYPSAIVSIGIYTLSTEEGWIGV